jgi:hypothetical protein
MLGRRTKEGLAMILGMSTAVFTQFQTFQKVSFFNALAAKKFYPSARAAAFA